MSQDEVERPTSDDQCPSSRLQYARRHASAKYGSLISIYAIYIYDQHIIFHVTFGDTQLALAPCDNKDAICVRYSIDAM